MFYYPACVIVLCVNVVNTEEFCTSEGFDLSSVKLSDSSELNSTRLFKNIGKATIVEPKLPYTLLVLFVENPKKGADSIDFQNFIASGVILNKKWILSRAIPITYHKFDDYSIIIKHEIPLNTSFNSLQTFKANYAAIHPGFSPTSAVFDLAIIRASKEFPSPQSKGADLATSALPINCRLFIWTLTPHPQNESLNDTFTMNLTRAELPVEIKTNTSTTLTFTTNSSAQPSHVNLGAPLVCSNKISGILREASHAISVIEDSWLRNIKFEVNDAPELNLKGRQEKYLKCTDDFY